MTFSKFILALSLIGFLGTGCSNNNYENSQTEKSTNEDTNKSSSNPEEEVKQPAEEGETTFTFSATSNHQLLGGKRRVFNYDLENERLELLVPIPDGLDMIEFEAELPNKPEIKIEMDSEENALVLSFPLKNYLDIVRNPSGLPNNRPLPGINGGEPPSFGFTLPFNDVNAYGYAAIDSISLYLELDMKVPFSFNFPLLSEQNNTRVGKFYVLQAVNGHKGGVFLTLSLPDELSVLIANAQ